MRQIEGIIRRVRWLPITVVLLCMSAIVWVLINPAAYPSCLVLVGAAIPIAILGRDSPP